MGSKPLREPQRDAGRAGRSALAAAENRPRRPRAEPGDIGGGFSGENLALFHYNNSCVITILYVL